MKDFSVNTDEQSAVMLKYRCEQQELEHQRNVLEDLEFQMFEVTVFVIQLFLLLEWEIKTELLFMNANRCDVVPSVHYNTNI